MENDEAQLLNPDGYTRWWNYPEFTDPLPLFSYKPFPQGTWPFPSATINPYKYYADDVSFESDVADLPPETRGVFSTDPAPRERNYRIQFPVEDGSPVFRFNVAVAESEM